MAQAVKAVACPAECPVCVVQCDGISSVSPLYGSSRVGRGRNSSMTLGGDEEEPTVPDGRIDFIHRSEDRTDLIHDDVNLPEARVRHEIRHFLVTVGTTTVKLLSEKSS
jgi:hypothetical protein